MELTDRRIPVREIAIYPAYFFFFFLGGGGCVCFFFFFCFFLGGGGGWVGCLFFFFFFFLGGGGVGVVQKARPGIPSGPPSIPKHPLITYTVAGKKNKEEGKGT